MMTLWTVAIVLGSLIIAALAFYLGRLLLLVKQGKKAQAQIHQAQINKRNKTLAESIYTIAWAMRDGQCDFSEGCLRIWVLLDHYVEQPEDGVLPTKSEVYPGIFNMYEKIKDMPTHEARKKYKKSELMVMDKQRATHETQYKPMIEGDIAKLIERFVSRKSSI
ncbi:MAG: hypothetical protein ACI9FJ_001066 [Alteromonadaceae bacterium]|jgi:hypothetical protein